MGKKRVMARFQEPMRRRARPGVCRWCRCSHTDPCPAGCGWANAERTLCTACVDVDREWRHLKGAQPATAAYAFFRGFLVGAEDPRMFDLLGNPYPVEGRQSRYWALGKVAGARQAR